MATSVPSTVFVDEPHSVVIQLDQKITCAQAQALGKILGANGFTGSFVGGDTAELCRLGAMWKNEHAKNGKHR